MSGLTLSSSDIIQIIGIVISFFTSILAIVISVKTLQQNSKMIEDSSRPYIGIYGSGVYIQNSNYYLIVKNFGNSSATIHSFTYDFDIAKFTFRNPNSSEPFQFIEGSTIMPGQAFYSLIDFNKAHNLTRLVNFHIVYSSGCHTYEDDICLNLSANIGNFVTHSTKKDDELSVISETLQEMHLHSL